MFTKGNTYGKGRPAGSQNKLTKSSKDFLKSVLFNEVDKPDPRAGFYVSFLSN